MKQSFTVITTYYQGGQYLSRLVEMMRNNFNNLKHNHIECDFEFILINDSPWEEINLEDHNIDFDISVYRNKENYGIHKSRVEGIKKANGNYLLILDQDDEIADDYLVQQYRAIADKNIVVCNGIKEFEQGNKEIYRSNKKMSLINKKDVYLKAANQIVSPGQCLIRKDTIPDSWLDNPLKNNGSDDLMLWLLLLDKGETFKINNKKLYIHKQVGDNLSNSLEKMCKSDLEMCDIMLKRNLLSRKDINKRKRLCSFLRENGYTNKFNIFIYLKYIDIVLWKFYAYFR